MSKRKILLLVLVLITVGLATRFFFLIPDFPHLPNFTAIGAVALFGAYHLKKKQALIVPIAILWASDILLNNLVYPEYFTSFTLLGDPWVYLGFIAIILIGFALLKKLSVKNIVFASLVGGFAFYMITNFAVWLTSAAYPKSFAGLLECYAVAIPFFRNALLGNIFYSFVLFGVYDLITARRLSFLSSEVEMN